MVRKAALVAVAVMAAATTAEVPRAVGSACAPPAVSIGDAQPTYEGTFVGQTDVVFPVTVAVAVGCPAPTGQVAYASEYGTAGPADFAAVSGVLSWDGGAEPQSVTVAVVADAVAENPESFTVHLSAPVGMVIAAPTGHATILDDERPPLVVSLDGGKICWRDPLGITAATCPVPVRLSTTARAPVTVHYRTHRVGADPLGYVPVRDGVVTIRPGQSGGVLPITVLSDGRKTDERLIVEIFAPSAGVVGVPRGDVVIRPGR